MAATANGNGYISRGSLTAAISGGALLLALLGGFFSYQNAATDQRLKDLQQEVAINRKDVARLTADNAAFQKEVSRLDADRKRTEDDVRRLDAKVVSREEHASNDRERQTIISGLALRVDRIERDFGSTYNLKDALADMQKRMDRLSALITAPGRKNGTPTE